MLELSIIIITWNSGEAVIKNLNNLLQKSSIAIEIIVVDNGSSDGTPVKIQNHFPEVTCISLENNNGFSKAVNIGAKKASGEYVLLLNDDAFPTINDIEELIMEAKQLGDELGVLGVQLIFPGGKKQNSIASIPSLATELLNKSMLKRVFPKKYPSKKDKFHEITEVPSVIGACLLTPLKLFKSLKGLDERYFFYLEETDYCLRVKSHGKKVYHLPTVRIEHELGRSSRKVVVWSKVQYLKSLSTFFTIHYGKRSQFLLESCLFFQYMTKLTLSMIGVILFLGNASKLKTKVVCYHALLKHLLFHNSILKKYD
jgi:GT2 family glycosyltransferase